MRAILKILQSRMKQFLSGFVVGFLWALLEYETILRFFCKGKVKFVDSVDPGKVGMKPFIELKYSSWSFSISFIVPIWIF